MSKRSKPLLSFPGGKAGVGVYQNIINRMPPHDLYIEAFLGGGAVLLNKRPALNNIGIDLDQKVIAAWSQYQYPDLQIIHGDALDFLSSRIWNEAGKTKTLVYCDPPYLRDARRTNTKLYDCDLSDEASHTKLLCTLKHLPCMVMLSGYASPLYHSLLSDWRQAHFQTRNRAGHPTRETIWMNYPEPSKLHDYRYLGHGFRERQRIKRQQNRWRNRLLSMPELERNSLIDALYDLFSQDEHAQQSDVSTSLGSS